jgi:hypothetical protein
MFEYLKQRIQTDTKFVGDSQIKIICSNIDSVPEELKQFSEDIAMNVGTFHYEDDWGH